MRTSEKLAELAADLAAAQAEIMQPGQDANNKGVGSGYATLAAVQNATRAVLARHGLAVVQTTSTPDGATDGEAVTITTRLLHKSGEWLEDSITVPVEIPVSNAGKPTLSRGQATGVSITYQRRYALSAMLGVASEKDEDGAAPEGSTWSPPGAVAAPITPAQPNQEQEDW